MQTYKKFEYLFSKLYYLNDINKLVIIMESNTNVFIKPNQVGYSNNSDSESINTSSINLNDMELSDSDPTKRMDNSEKSDIELLREVPIKTVSVIATAIETAAASGTAASGTAASVSSDENNDSGGHVLGSSNPNMRPGHDYLLRSVGKTGMIMPNPTYRRRFATLTDVEKPLGVVGLTNLGNTCYMNSVLQCLFNTPDFNTLSMDNDIVRELYPYIIKTVDEPDKKNYSVVLAKTQLTITFQMYKLMKAIWSNQTKHIRPINFRNVFANKIDGFQSFEQQDCQEALLCILDTIHTELQKPVDIEYNFIPEEYKKYIDIIEKKKLSDIECCGLEMQYPDIWELLSIKRTLDKHNGKTYSHISKLFQNVVSSTLQCPDCCYHTYNFDPSIILTIPIPNERKVNMEAVNEKMSKLPSTLPAEKLEQIRKHIIMAECQSNKFTLNECFENLVQTEKLDEENKWHCPNCDLKVCAWKKFNIWIPSKVMIIQIKRFVHNISSAGYSATKLNNMVEYPINDFNINKYMSDFSSKLGNYTYDLYAVSNHIGNMNGGHYFAFVKSQTNNKWYCADDDNITEMEESDVLTQNAYMLFYKLRE